MNLIDCVKKIGEEIEEDDIAKIKENMKDYVWDDFPKTSGVEFLSELVSRHMITGSDTRLLEEILYVLARKTLIDYLIAFKSEQHLDVIEEQDRKDDMDMMEPVTFLFKCTKPGVSLIRGLLNHLSELLALPPKYITISNHEDGSVTVMMKEMYVEILQDVLQNDRRETGLNSFCVTDIQIGTKPNVSYYVEEPMIPNKNYKVMIDAFEEMRNRYTELLKKLGDFEENFGNAVQMNEQLDPNSYVVALRRLFQKSGMSTTLWKTLGKLTYKGQLSKNSTPYPFQEELRQQCLYSKARLMRLYPGRIWEVQKKQ